ncbi:MAG TPA: flippase [Methylomirabilota bacterium]|nr:flippase [Methylomirabilota bacterium]
MEFGGKLLVRNTGLNVLSQATPFVAALLAIPLLVPALGVERFGVLSLVWVLLANVAIFDVGLGRATTRTVAEALGGGNQEDIPRLVWTAAAVQLLVGATSGLLGAGLAPVVVGRVLSVSPDLAGDAQVAFVLVALTIPVIAVSTSFAGALEAAQRFDLVMAVRLPTGVLTFLMPLIGVLLGFGLPGIVGLLLLARAGALLAWLVLSMRIFPDLKRLQRPRRALMARLWSFGGWIAMCQIAAPCLRYVDRYVIGALLSMSALAYYAAPFDLIERVWMLPTSLVLTLFPAFTALSGRPDLARARQLFVRSVSYLVLAMSPIALVLTVYAGPLLGLWLGEDFARHGTLPLQLFALTSMFAAIAPVSGSVIEGYGRPRVIATLYLCALPLNAALTWALVNAIGLPGAALSFGIRALAETAVLSVVASRIVHLRFTLAVRDLGRPLAIIVSLGAAGVMLDGLAEDHLLRAVAVCAMVVGAATASWHWVLTRDDRNSVLAVFGGRMP